MKTTLDLPEDLVREVKLRAVMQGRTLKDLVAEVLRRGLEIAPVSRSNDSPASERGEIDENGLPVIRCQPGAPASRMSLEELLALEQDALAEDDMKRAGLSP